MALKFYLLKIKNIKQETEDAVSVEFEIPDDLKEIFKYKHGQYVTIKVPIGETDERRAYSISSSPILTDNITVAIKEKEDGFVSKYLNNEIKEGDMLEVMPPLGNFTIELDDNNSRQFVMFGGGSGITPLLSIMTTVLHKEPESSVKLFYSNSNENSIIYKEEVEKLKSEFKERFEFFHILSRPEQEWKGLTGRIDEVVTKEILENHVEDIKNKEYFLCGHQGMMQSIKNVFSEKGIPQEKIHTESFTVELPESVKDAESATESTDDFNEDNLIPRKVKLILYNEELEMEVQPDETILTAAQREGFDPPFSCQIGACSTCRAKLESGKVWMEEHDALTDIEMEEGYVLTCQAHPVSDDVVVNYDEY